MFCIKISVMMCVFHGLEVQWPDELFKLSFHTSWNIRQYREYQNYSETVYLFSIYLVAYLSSYHEIAINALYELA